MGLLKAFTGSAVSYLNDLWEDYIYCDALDENTLVQKGRARRSPGAGNRANDNVITEGSRIAVNAGQALLVVENGQIVDFTTEQGGYEYRRKTEPSLFCGDFGDALKVSFYAMKSRFAYGGQPANDQRVYFVNTKEILNNRFGFGNVPYRDAEFNLTILLQGFGVYSFRITNPLIFYMNVSGNVAEQYQKSSFESQLKAEIQNALLPALGTMAQKGVPYDQISMQTDLLIGLLRKQLCEDWRRERGIEIEAMAFRTVLPDDGSVEKIRQLQESRAYSGDKAMLGARVGAAQAQAMEDAAKNPAGAVNGFMGMGMAQSAGAVNVSELMKDAPARPKAPEPAKAAEPDAAEPLWICSCGRSNSLKFCPACGAPRPGKKRCPFCSFEIPAELSDLPFCPNCGKEIHRK